MTGFCESTSSPSWQRPTRTWLLTTPPTYTGPPEELDAELGKHLAGYVQTRTQTASTLAEAKATLEAVVPSITFFAISAAQPAFAM
jgi:hypothetical protein